MQVLVRHNHAVHKVNVDDSIPVKRVIESICNSIERPDDVGKQLVISPTSNQPGAAIAFQTTLNGVMFKPSEDILELWDNPQLITVALFEENGSSGVIKTKKRMQIDFGVPLSFMIPTLQRVLQLDVNHDFIIKYCPSVDLNGNKLWLHSALSLEEHNISKDGVLLCYPIHKHLKIPEASITNHSIKGWLLKRSIKKDHSSAKQKRLFVFANGLLYYYRKEKESVAAGAIALEYYNISYRIQPKKKKYALMLSLSVSCFPQLTRVYKLQADNEEGAERWYEGLHHSCINYKSHRVFGVDLKTVVNRKGNQSKSVPNIVRDCISYLQEKGLDKEGIFRLSASASDINLYKEKYNQGGDVRFPPTLDHNVPAALLKYYLRELPEPLFPFQYFSQLIEIDTNSASFQDDLCRIIASLPIENYGTLKMIISFLGMVEENESVTKMSASNLATVIGPNIIRAQDGKSDVQYNPFPASGTKK